MPNDIHNVVLVGASGHLGEAVLPEFLKSDLHVSVITRPDSKATFPDGVTVLRANTTDVSALTEALKGQDAIVSLLSEPALQDHLLEAAKAAGLKWFVPSEFGHDTTDPLVLSLPLPLFGVKKDFTKKLDESGLGWTGIIPGMFFDWGLRVGFLGFNFKDKTAQIWDSGNSKFNTTNTTDIGRALVTLFTNAEAREKAHNKLMYINTCVTSQNEILAAAEKATGEKWTVTHVESSPILKNAVAGIQGGDYGMQNVGPLILAVPFTDGDHFGGKWRNWDQEGAEGTKLLLPGGPETVEETIKKIVAE